MKIRAKNERNSLEDIKFLKELIENSEGESRAVLQSLLNKVSANYIKSRFVNSIESKLNDMIYG